MERGKFIALEGIDGSGKSTQIRRLFHRLEEQGVTCHATREPTGRPVGSLIRQALTGRVPLDPRVIAALYAADRIDHLVNGEDGLAALVERGITVVTDRYYFSSYAYHSVDMDMDWVIRANSVSAGLLRPTLTVFLDIPVELALEHIRRSRDHVELFETEDRLRRTREMYFEAFERLKETETVAVVEGAGPEDEVARRIWAAVSPYLV